MSVKVLEGAKVYLGGVELVGILSSDLQIKKAAPVRSIEISGTVQLEGTCKFNTIEGEMNMTSKKGFPEKSATKIVLMYDDGSEYTISKATKVFVGMDRVIVDYIKDLGTGIREVRELQIKKDSGVEAIDILEPSIGLETTLDFDDNMKCIHKSVTNAQVWGRGKSILSFAEASDTLTVGKSEGILENRFTHHSL